MGKKTNKILIFICGFMGAGKSTLISRINEENSGFQFVELDSYILDKFGKGEKSVAELIEKNGFNEFRNFEDQALKDIVNSNKFEGLVVSLGGGILSDTNLEFILRLENSYLVWADTPFEPCYQRIIENREQRPLASMSKSELQELYLERLVNYKRATVRISVEQLAKIKNLEDFLSLIRQ